MPHSTRVFTAPGFHAAAGVVYKTSMSTPARRHRWILDACLGAALVLAGCNKTKDDALVEPHGGGASKGDPTAPVELAPVEHPSQMLGRDTALLMMGTSMNRAAEAFERDRLVKAFGPQYTSIRAVMVSTVGHDLLDPAAWADVGLDASGPLGLAMTDLVNPHVVLFATVSDRAKLVGLVRKLAGNAQMEVIEEPYGSASILRPGGGDKGGALVLRDRIVAVVLDTGEDSVEVAKRLVTMDPNVSLAAQTDYRKATGGLRAADLSVYFDLAGMVDQANAQSKRHAADPDSNWAQEELVKAQKEGAGPERLAELERQAEEVRANDERWRRRAEGERALAELLVSGVEGVGFTATAKRGGPVFDGRMVAGPDAFLRRLLVNREGAAKLPLSLNGAPLWCGSGRVDPAAAYELLEAIAAAEGEKYSAFLARAKAELGLDLEAELRPVLVGDAELCMTFEGKLGEKPLDRKTQLGLGATLRVSDAAKAKYLLAKMATSGSELGKLMKKRGEGYAVEVPDWRTMYLQTAGDRIVVSSDPELAKRLSAGDPGSMPSEIRPSAARGAMDLPGTAASQAFDLSMGVLWTMVGRVSMSAPMMSAPGMTQEELEKVPLSAKTKKARKAMEKAQARVDELEAKREAAQMKQVLAISDALGIVVAAVTEDDRGFTLTGGQFLRVASLGQMLEVVLGGVMNMSGGTTLDEADQEAMELAWQRYSDAQQAFINARLEDAERFQAKKGR